MKTIAPIMFATASLICANRPCMKIWKISLDAPINVEIIIGPIQIIHLLLNNPKETKYLKMNKAKIPYSMAWTIRSNL